MTFGEGGLLANHDDCSLRARLLIKHVSHGRLWFFPENKEGGAVFTLSLGQALEHQCFLKGRFICI